MLQILKDYEQRRLVCSQRHPTLPLSIWNYTPECQYSEMWDDVTVQCRGLVVHDDGHIVSRGFNKFWNIEEKRHTPTNDFEVFEKLDGQYIGCFWYGGEMIVNSRGSFTSKYAVEAKRILDEKYPVFKECGCYYESFEITHCFELVGFEQIVVSYPEPELICTGLFRNDGKEGWKDLSIDDDSETLKIPKSAKKYDGLDYTNIKQLIWPNSEGFVVKFSNGQRCKIKFQDYIRLHRAMTNLSTTAIWEALQSGQPVSSILQDVPDEFYDKVRKCEQSLINHYKLIERTAKAQFDLVRMAVGCDSSRKKFAEICKKIPNNTNRSIIFAMLDGKDYSKYIWNFIKPRFKKI
jgi:RNA ligase